jgi:hypothetical protein
MRFDDLLASDAGAVAREVSGIDPEAHLAKVLDALGAVETPDATGCSARLRAGLAPALGDQADRPEVRLEDEFTACLRQAEEGDPASTRRVAELLELNERTQEAAAWWCRAAKAGDRDAIAYLQEKTR